ncbi:hypothetical protein Hamer_G015574 [Homarus americanus]|uniref:Uncharacterized protein n=1 Tax=Homarus americanus TaxID=6706 RepID=A0A8J5MKP5_HOMAM|nr:hypothetical protein Hamer_G015574 [Homarus americanus]
MRRVPGDAKEVMTADSDTDGSHKTAERTDNTHRNRETTQANMPRTGMDKSRHENSEEEPLTARRPCRTIKPKKYQMELKTGSDGSKSSGMDEVDDPKWMER